MRECGILQHSPSSDYAELFGIEADLGETPPRYNLAPSQPMLVARTAPGGTRALTYLRWGLVPLWWKGQPVRAPQQGSPWGMRPPVGGPSPLTGARPTKGQIPSALPPVPPPPLGARQPFQHDQRPCRAGGPETRLPRTLPLPPLPHPHRRVLRVETRAGRQAALPDPDALGRPFALAGLWDHWQDPNGLELETCTIVVTDATARIAPIHEPMPVILHPGVWDTWLDPRPQDSRTPRSLLIPCDPAPLGAYSVSRAVNNTRHDGPSLMAPLVAG